MRSTQDIYYLDESGRELSFRQRWNSYLTITLVIGAVLLGLALRSGCYLRCLVQPLPLWQP